VAGAAGSAGTSYIAYVRKADKTQGNGSEQKSLCSQVSSCPVICSVPVPRALDHGQKAMEHN